MLIRCFKLCRECTVLKVASHKATDLLHHLLLLYFLALLIIIWDIFGIVFVDPYFNFPAPVKSYHSFS